MAINYKILETVQSAGAQLVAVTKYLSPEATDQICAELLAHPAVIGLGENRITSMVAKNLPRAHTHFIGRLQSRSIAQIVQSCSVIHSLDQLSHAQKIDRIAGGKNLLIKIFIQINISEEAQKGGIHPEELAEFLQQVKKLRSCEVVGLSGMGSLVRSEERGVKSEIEKKQQEFLLLKRLRDKYLPKGLISAGTSSDYQIALESGIDIVRIGRALF